MNSNLGNMQRRMLLCFFDTNDNLMCKILRSYNSSYVVYNWIRRIGAFPVKHKPHYIEVKVGRLWKSWNFVFQVFDAEENVSHANKKNRKEKKREWSRTSKATKQ